MLMPVYNTEKYLKQAIDSILSQTFTDFEFIIIDDASTDNCVEIIKSYSDTRIQLIVKAKNTGYIDSLNLSLKLAKGKFIARMDSDDISGTRRFEKQVAVLTKNNDLIGCSTNMQYLNESGELASTRWEVDKEVYIPWELLWDNPICHPSVMINTAILEKELYCTASFPAEDYEMWLRISLHGKLYRIPEVLLFYRRLERSEFHRNQTQAFNSSLIFNQRYTKALVIDMPEFHQKLTNFWSYLGNNYDTEININTIILWLKKLKSALIAKHGSSAEEVKLMNIGIYDKVLNHIALLSKIKKMLTIITLPFFGINTVNFLHHYSTKRNLISKHER